MSGEKRVDLDAAELLSSLSVSEPVKATEEVKPTTEASPEVAEQEIKESAADAKDEVKEPKAEPSTPAEPEENLIKSTYEVKVKLVDLLN